MKKSLVALAAAFLAGALLDPKRARTHDNNSFTYRMGAGFAGDVNRTHPASIYPGLQDSTQPVRRYGEGAILDTSHNAFRGLKTTDANDSTAILLNAVSVRDFPVQAASAAGNYGQQALSDAVTMPTTGPLSFLTEGRILVKVRGSGTLTINSAVFVFCSADETGHVLGGFEAAAISGKTVPITNCKYRGPADSNGIAELEIWPQA